MHPLHLTEEERAAWGELLGDYEIMSPFPQLTRKVYRLEPGEEEQKEFVRGRNLTLSAVAFVGILERLGWVRGPADTDGTSWYVKPFRAAHVTAFVQYHSAFTGYHGADLQLQCCFILSGEATSTGVSLRGDRLPLGKVDPVVVSEVMSLLSVLSYRAC